MTFVEVLQLIGYSFGAALHLWIGALLARGRANAARLERVLLLLVFCIGAWHASNLALTLGSLLGFALARPEWLISVFETCAVVAITVSYSLLLHAHLHLWAQARRRGLKRIEKWRVWLSYVPLGFLFSAVPALWRGGAEPMLEKLTRVDLFGFESNFVLAFALWAAYALLVVGTTDLLIFRSATDRRERTLMLTLAVSFFLIAGLILLVHVLRIGAATPLGDLLQTAANLGSLLPTALLAYHIYRYRYLELVIRDSLVVALFAVVILVSYLYGVRAVSAALTARYALRAGVVDSLLILLLALLAAPLRAFLERRFTRLLTRETAIYGDVLTRIGSLSRETRRYRQLPELLGFVAERSRDVFGLRRVRFALRAATEIASPTSATIAETADYGSEAGATIDLPQSDGSWRRLEADVVVEDMPGFGSETWSLAFALRRENEMLGAMLIDASPERLTPDVRRSLAVIAGQVALALAECRLIEENIQLERRLAQDERLAELGRMAATVAHEVKNPLSAIKSIAQVMREDDALADAYARDLDLIVGEADRLGRSVTHLLKWTRNETAADAPSTADEVARAVLRLFAHEARQRLVRIEHEACAGDFALDGKQTAALRDALANLIANALQATPHGGTIRCTTGFADGALLVRVADGGAGVPAELREQIWQPFFTTKQRGTGLGLAIVRKRMEEVGGAAALVPTLAGSGACFELRLPVAAVSETPPGAPLVGTEAASAEHVA